MNKERYNQVIDEVYGNYLDGGEVKWLKQMEVNTPIGKMNIPIPHPKEEFINKCKTDSEFSERWGLKVEERELSDDERSEIRDMQYFKNNLYQALKGSDTKIDWENIPTKLITITYNDKIVESYE
jgi:hypothetical protein